jgi:hypothetical protein
LFAKTGVAKSKLLLASMPIVMVIIIFKLDAGLIW